MKVVDAAAKAGLAFSITMPWCASQGLAQDGLALEQQVTTIGAVTEVAVERVGASPVGTLWDERLLVSPDRSRIGYVARTATGMEIRVTGEAPVAADAVASVVVGDRGFAALFERGGERILCVDGAELRWLGTILGVRRPDGGDGGLELIEPDGVAVARANGGRVEIERPGAARGVRIETRDGVLHLVWGTADRVLRGDRALSLVSDASGQHVYCVTSGAGEQAMLWVDGELHSHWDEIGAVRTGPDGRWAALGVVGGTARLLVDGRAVGAFDPPAERQRGRLECVFAGERWACVAPGLKGRALVVDGETVGVFDEVAALAFSPDGAKLAHITRTGASWGLDENGVRIAESRAPAAAAVALGQRRLCPGGGATAHVPGSGAPLAAPTYTADSGHLAYLVREGDAWSVAVAGVGRGAATLSTPLGEPALIRIAPRTFRMSGLGPDDTFVSVDSELLAEGDRIAQLVARIPTAYRARFGAKRAVAPKVRRATERGLAWLAANQEGDGRWDSARFGGGERYDVGVTGLALLALLGDGSTPEVGPYAAEVARGVAWLAAGQDRKTGRLVDNRSGSFIYQHAIASLALVEAYGLTADAGLSAPAQRAIAYLESHRNPYLVWRYQPADGDNDTSVTCWCWQACHAAAQFGLTTADDLPGLVTAWLDRVTDPVTGRVGYTERGAPSPRVDAAHGRDFPTSRSESLTAAALYSRLLLGQGRQEPALAKATELVLRCTPGTGKKDSIRDEIYWYYASQALALQGDDAAWGRWRSRFQPHALRLQEAKGDATGSWAPDGVWSREGGRVFATAMTLLALEAEIRLVRGE